MTPEESKRIKGIYTKLALALLGLIAVYIVVSALVLKRTTIAYNVVIVVGLTVFWALMDIVGPIKAQEFDGKTKEQMDNYKKLAAADLVGYGGLMYFALAMHSSTSIYGAVVYLLSSMMKKRFRDAYEGVDEDSGSDAQTEDDLPAVDLLEESDVPAADAPVVDALEESDAPVEDKQAEHC